MAGTFNVRFDSFDHVACEACWPTSDARQLLLAATIKTPVHTALFGSGASQEALEERLRIWPQVMSRVLRKGPAGPPGPFGIWSYAFPLAHYIHQSRFQIFGLAGAPGSGKSTLASLVSICLSALDERSSVLQVSLDDFYFSKAERESRGIRFRAQPGSHDLDAAAHLLFSARNKEPVLHVPRFDHAADDCLTAERFEGPASIVLLEGWFVGMREHGYDLLSEHLDHLIYIDCPTNLARDRRLGREERVRVESGGTRGFSAEAMGQFWDEILEPGITNWVNPVRAAADVVIELDQLGQVTRVLRNSQLDPRR